MASVKIGGKVLARRGLGTSHFEGVRSRPPAWRHADGPLGPSALTADLLRRVAHGELAGERRTDLSPELLTCSGWSHLLTALSTASFRIALERHSERGGPRRLTAREYQVSSLVAGGHGSNHIGELLSMASATARAATERSLRKLGLASSLQLSLVWHTLRAPCLCFRESDGREVLLFQTSFDALGLQRFTGVEWLLLLSLLKGETNLEIAKARSVSPRTVANQLSSLYRRFGVRSRNALVARLFDRLTPPGPSGPK